MLEDGSDEEGALQDQPLHTGALLVIALIGLVLAILIPRQRGSTSGPGS